MPKVLEVLEKLRAYGNFIVLILLIILIFCLIYYRKVLRELLSQFTDFIRDVDEIAIGKFKFKRKNKSTPVAKPSEPVIRWGDKTLDELRQTLLKMPIPSLVPASQFLNKRILLIKEHLKDVQKEVSVVAYSGISWCTALTGVIEQVVWNGKWFRILLVHPDSVGIREKAALETWEADKAEIEQWKQDMENETKHHQDDIFNTILLMHKLRGKLARHPKGDLSKLLQVRFYWDTPTLRGWFVDDQTLILSTYFYYPIKRGFQTPSFVLMKSEMESGSVEEMFLLTFRNWFDIKFATGEDAFEYYENRL